MPMNNSSKNIVWPEGKKFAFTIFDDTDNATLENIRPVYDFLSEHGFRITKSVWPLKGEQKPRCGGITCEDKDYVEMLLDLKRAGFEIGYHMATYHSSVRADTIRGLNKFEKIFGSPPSAMANHSECIENMYWGSARLGGVNRVAYNLMTRMRFNNRYKGHIKDDPHFWGDLCQGKITYVRNFVFANINTLAECPFMPYHDLQRPYVNFWFSSSEGSEINSFNKTISEENLDRLESEGGACIMYTHFGCGFYENKNLNNRFVKLMKLLRKKNGWFVPVSTLLDYLKKNNGSHVITDNERTRLERKWLKHKFLTGRS